MISRLFWFCFPFFPISYKKFSKYRNYCRPVTYIPNTNVFKTKSNQSEIPYHFLFSLQRTEWCERERDQNVARKGYSLLLLLSEVFCIANKHSSKDNQHFFTWENLVYFFLFKVCQFLKLPQFPKRI